MACSTYIFPAYLGEIYKHTHLLRPWKNTTHANGNFHVMCGWFLRTFKYLVLLSLLYFLSSYPKIHFLCQDPKMYVQTILDVHKKYNALVMSAFNNDAGFVAALDKVCNSSDTGSDTGC